MRARWVAARRAEGRRRLRWLLAVAIVVLLVVLAWGVSVSPLLAVDHVVLRGAQHTTALQVESAAGIHPGDALAWIDAGGAAAGVEALPYVRTARVQRLWPHTVRISVVERVPVAWVDGGGRRALVDGTGRILELVTGPPPGLPQVVGTARIPDPGATLTGAAGRAAAHVAAGLLGAGVAVQSVAVGPAGVSLALANGPEVRLGDPDQVAVKLHAAEAVLGAMTAAGAAVHYVDVSVPSNPVAG